MSLLGELGYTNLREYTGGMAEWTDHGGPLETGEGRGGGRSIGIASADTRFAGASDSPVSGARATPAGRRRVRPFDALDALGSLSVRGLLLAWLGMVLGFGAAYWGACAWRGNGLVASGEAVTANLTGFLTAVYFSFVTATSVGYGDVVPAGFVRVLAIAEAAAGLLLFGCVISKLLSRRQEHLIEEIHRTTFEERLGRVRTNLHLVLSELQANAAMCADPSIPRERIVARVESAVMVFSGELRSIHDLLYRPQQNPDEQVLEAILANLTAAFGELRDLIALLPQIDGRAGLLRTNLRTISALASEICGECVPRAYAPHLKEWMNRIQTLAHDLASASGPAPR